jgi:hypothetical protein
MVSSNRMLHSVLLGKGNKVFHREDVVGHNYENFPADVPRRTDWAAGQSTPLKRDSRHRSRAATVADWGYVRRVNG